jgi:hypothetical protein
MLDQRDLDARAEKLQRLLEEKYRLRSRDLPQALRRAGRRLPRRHRAQAEAFQKARAMAGHPRLAVQVNGDDITRGYAETMAYLKSVDPWAARRDRLLNLAALIAFYILVVLAGFIWWMRARGYV